MNKTDKKNIIKYAFTLGEILIVLSIMGVLATFMMISFSKAMPDKNKTMFKKAYSLVEKTVTELINDEALYPYDPDFVGFTNYKTIDEAKNDSFLPDNELECNIYGVFKNKSGKNSCTNGIKFNALFKSKLNVVPDENTCPEGLSGTCFTTSDGIGWTIEEKDFGEGSDRKLITIDVNGFNKGPNEILKNNPNGDRFKVYVHFDGKVSVEDGIEKKYLSEQAVQKEDN